MSHSMDSLDGLASYVAAHQQVLYTFCYRVLGDAAGAARMVQQVLEEGWPPEQWPDARAETVRLLALAYGLAMRSERRIAKRRSRSGTVVAAAANDQAIDPELLLGTLPIDRRCLIILNACCGLTVAEVAAAAGLRLDEAQAKLVEARRALVLDTGSLAETVTPPTARTLSGAPATL